MAMDISKFAKDMIFTRHSLKCVSNLLMFDSVDSSYFEKTTKIADAETSGE